MFARADNDNRVEQAGLDSLASVELRNTLSKLYERDLPATILMEQPTVSALAAFLQPATHPAKSALLAPFAQPTHVAHRDGRLSHTKLLDAAGRFPQASGKDAPSPHVVLSKVWEGERLKGGNNRETGGGRTEGRTVGGHEDELKLSKCAKRDWGHCCTSSCMAPLHKLLHEDVVLEPSSEKKLRSLKGEPSHLSRT